MFKKRLRMDDSRNKYLHRTKPISDKEHYILLKRSIVALLKMGRDVVIANSHTV